MKAIETLQFRGKQLCVSVYTLPDDENKGYFSYFIDGKELLQFSNDGGADQAMLITMCDILANEYNLIKWSY